MAKGIKLNTETTVAYVKNGTLKTKTVAGSSYQEYNKDDRTAIVDGIVLENIVTMVIPLEDYNYKTLIAHANPVLKKSDTRKKRAELCGKKEQHTLEKMYGIISPEEFDLKFAEIELDLKNTSDTVKYEIVWGVKYLR